MKCIIFFILILVLFYTQAMAQTGLDKAANRCRVEVDSFVENKLNGKVNYPIKKFTSQMSNAYFIHYRQDLKATAHFKDGSTHPLDIRCTIEKGSFDPLMININGTIIAP